MKTGRIKRLDNLDKSWVGQGDRTFHDFAIEFEDGAYGTVSFASEEPWAKIGMEVQYQGPEGKYNKIKLKPPPRANGGVAAAPRNEQLDCAIHSLEMATRLVVAGLVEKERIYDSALKMKQWLIANGGES